LCRRISQKGNSERIEDGTGTIAVDNAAMQIRAVYINTLPVPMGYPIPYKKIPPLDKHKVISNSS
jgi:hypothetical protein